MHNRITAFRALRSAILIALPVAVALFVGSAVARPSQHSGLLFSVHRGSVAHARSRRAPKLRQAIIGGSPAPAGSLPWMAFVIYSGTPSFACSGTVISPNVILTAGHCVVDQATGVAYPPGGYQVITGTLDATDVAAGQLSGVSRTIVYPGFDRSTVDGDAGLLVLSTPTRAPAIRLATPADIGLSQPGTGGLIAGWGETQYGAARLPAVLQWGTTVVQSAAYCQQFAGLYDTLKLCATDAPSFSHSTCFGDSGGPLVALGNAGEPVEIGITSTGASDCATAVPNVFTRADLISSWTAGWIAAVALPPATPPPTTSPSNPGAPPPPTRQLPTMTPSNAASYTRQTLQGVFGRKFTSGQHYQAQCSRQAPARFRCRVAWAYGQNKYRGSVTVSYALIGGHAKWSDNYRVSAIADHCNSYSSYPKSCKVHVAHGSW
jgi:secreted trypsin-like serine protease